ncbi:hypothetical protein [Pseudorhodoferax sp.]|uniref:hypothetical protein n=1 Tax=Pseudorhodoferax sp. TaxID=1993553 RepID=UPI002DD666AB|nr:hypothetical protein [Pseudorhodoferax sp.]
MMLLFGVLIAFALAWVFDVGGLRRAWPLPAGVAAGLPSLPSLTSLKPAPAAGPAPEGRWRKCVGNERTVYTDAACPPGFAEQAVAEPALTVLPAPPQAPAPPAPDTGTGPAKPGAGALERQVDQALQR